MKTLKILFLLISLSMSVTGYACWDDEDDDWNIWNPWNEDDDDDGSYDYGSWTDAGWDGYGSNGKDDGGGSDYDYDDYYGYGVVITPDDNDNDDDWWRQPDQGDDYSNDENDIENDNSDDDIIDDKNIDNKDELNRKTPSQITNTAKNTVATIISKYGTKNAYCNFGVKIAFKSLFNKNDLEGKRANDMVRYWMNNPIHWERISITNAQRLANEGFFVVAGWINPTGNSGHVVVIVPGESTYSGSWGGYVPNAMDTGYMKRSSCQPISKSFGSSKKNEVVFFKYK